MTHRVRACIGFLVGPLMLLALGAGPAVAVEHHDEGTRRS